MRADFAPSKMAAEMTEGAEEAGFRLRDRTGPLDSEEAMTLNFESGGGLGVKLEPSTQKDAHAA